MAVILIRDEYGDDCVNIDVQARTFPNSENSWDKNHLDSPSVVHVGGFIGQIPARFHTWDLQKFRDELSQLYEKLEGEALLSTVEGWITSTCKGDGLGHISLVGGATDEMGNGDRLNFEFKMDQTFLPDILSQLDDVLAKFPKLDGIQLQ